MIFGVPLLTSPDAVVGTVWGLPAERVVTVVRRDAEVQADRSVFFTSDRSRFGPTCQIRFGFSYSVALIGAGDPW